jgi:uncharacterized protein YkwD
MPPRLRIGSLRKGLAVVTATGLVGAAAVFGAATADAATTQTGSCVDGGGIRWTAKAIWGGTYTSGGVRKISINYAGWTTNGGAVPTDSAVRTYSGDGTRIQKLTWSGVYDYKDGTAYRVRNPRNPASAPGKAKIKITLGVDGDGHGSCSVTFTQPGSAGGGGGSGGGGSTSDRYEADVVSGTNAERTSRELQPLSSEACVDRYAEQQAARMAAERRMYHQDLGPILHECNLRGVGENVAYGYPSGSAVVAGWMGSSGHRANILNSSYRLLGVGAVQSSDGRWYAAQVFGA